MTAETILESLDNLINQRIKTLSSNKLTWAIDDIAFHLNRTPHYAATVITKSPDFPAPIKLDKNAKPLWLRTDVEKYILTCKSKKAA
jgi:hypothetical protein